MSDPTRREFVTSALALAGLMTLPAGVLASHDRGGVGAGAIWTPSAGQRRFTGSLVDTLCPGDAMTPDGSACGLADAVDGLLAGPYGTGPSSADPSRSRRDLYARGVDAVERAARARFGAPFSALDRPTSTAFLGEVRAGRVVQDGVDLASWSSGVVDPLLVKACFAAPVYNRHGSRVFSKVFEGVTV